MERKSLRSWPLTLSVNSWLLILVVILLALSGAACTRGVSTPQLEHSPNPGPSETAADSSTPTLPVSPPTLELPTSTVAHPTGEMSTTPRASIYPCDLSTTDLPIFTVEIVNRYPHDPFAYTQGLIFHEGFLFESTGIRGQSSLRRVTIETGEVVQRLDIGQPYFAEGLTQWDGRLVQLTWQENTGFVYDLASFERLDEFYFPTQGWGLTQDGAQLIASDGSEWLYFLDPVSYEITNQFSVSDDRGPVYRINELEWVDGQIWGNIYQTSCIARIDPQTGEVVGWIDISDLHDAAVEISADRKDQVVPPEVPNGIAYAPGGRLFLTGKFWPALFEVRIIPADSGP